MTHTCNAHGCPKNVPPRMFMCKRHWTALPKAIQRAIWREYRPGQERDKNPSAAYMAVQQWAIGTLAFKPNDEGAAQVFGSYMLRAMAFRTLAMDGGRSDPLRGLVPEGADLPDVTLEQAQAMMEADE